MEWSIDCGTKLFVYARMFWLVAEQAGGLAFESVGQVAKSDFLGMDGHRW